MTTTPTASPELLDLNRMSFLTGTIVAAPILATDIVMHDLRITKAGIIYKGEEVNDAGAVHAALMDVLVHGTQLPPRAHPVSTVPARDTLIECIAEKLKSQHSWISNVAAANIVRRFAHQPAQERAEQYEVWNFAHEQWEPTDKNGYLAAHEKNRRIAQQEPVAAPQQVAAPRAQLVIGVAAPQGATISILQPHADGTTTVIYGGTHPAGDSMGRAVVAAAHANSPEIPDGSLIDEGTSAPGTPEAPRPVVMGIDYSTDYLTEQRAAMRDAAAQLVENALEGSLRADTARAIRALDATPRAAQLDGGQEGSESNG